MIAMVAPYGFSDGFGNSLAVYVQIIEGEYDGILKWPFKKGIIMTLYDQKKELLQRRNYQFELKADALPANEAAYLRRPQREKPNHPFGCSRFCPLSAIMESTYALNDEVLIGVSVL